MFRFFFDVKWTTTVTIRYKQNKFTQKLFEYIFLYSLRTNNNKIDNIDMYFMFNIYLFIMSFKRREMVLSQYEYNWGAPKPSDQFATQ